MSRTGKCFRNAVKFLIRLSSGNKLLSNYFASGPKGLQLSGNNSNFFGKRIFPRVILVSFSNDATLGRQFLDLLFENLVFREGFCPLIEPGLVKAVRKNALRNLTKSF